MKSYTTIEQSQNLIRLGLYPQSADMRYQRYHNDVFFHNTPTIGQADIDIDQMPCWSAVALIALLRKAQECLEEGYWIDLYMNGIAVGNGSKTLQSYRFDDDIIDGLYGIVVWLLEKGYIKMEQSTETMDGGYD